jgi:hypothetical protein
MINRTGIYNSQGDDMCTKNRSVCLLLLVLVIVLPAAGCGRLRFAPSELEKQNVYLHQKTVEAAAVQAAAENSSADLQRLTRAAAQQSEAIVAHYGWPEEIPASESVDELLSAENGQITATARRQALERPDPWDVADHLLELGIAVAGVVGGVYGSRAIAALNAARQKSNALREVIAGNELFKQQNPEAISSFKEAQGSQSSGTRALVATIKNS